MISRFACTECGSERFVMEHYVFFDGNEFVPLHHPGEERALEELGHKTEHAVEAGRIFFEELCVCLDCRSLVPRRRLSTRSFWETEVAPAGFKASVVGAALASLVLLVFVRPLYVVPMVLIPVLVISFFEDRRRLQREARRATKRDQDLRRRTAHHELVTCSNCGSARLEEYGEHLARMNCYDDPAASKLLCPQCQRHALQFDPRYFAMA